MANSALELVAIILTTLGLILASASTGMPMWRVTAFIQENIITMETRWEGLWMNCYRQANIRMQCKVYDSLLYLPPELQASRGLMCCSVALAGVALLVSLAGLQCTSCIQDNPRVKRMILVVAGIMVLLACLCVLVPVSWTAHVIITDFYNPLLLDAQRRELGEALYVGWVGAGLLFAGGCIFTCCNLRSGEKYSERYRYSRSSQYSYPPPQVMHAHQPMPQPQVYPQLQPRPQHMLPRHPSSVYSYHSATPHHSRHPSVRSAMAYL